MKSSNRSLIYVYEHIQEQSYLLLIKNFDDLLLIPANQKP